MEPLFFIPEHACNAVEIIIKPLCTNQSNYPIKFCLSR
jgi:hypothetical protein